MVNFNSEAKTGFPALDADYWNKFKNDNKESQNILFDLNTKTSLKDVYFFMDDKK